MNRCQSLYKLRTTFDARLDRLERRLSVTASLPAHERDPLVAYVSVEALNAWSQFSKAFYLSCALNARTESKAKVQTTPPGLSMDDAIGRAILLYKPRSMPNSLGQWQRRDEPTWHDPAVLMRVCLNINCSLHSQMQAAFSSGQQVFADLPVFRNFYGHRNRLSSAAAQNLSPRYLLPSNLRPSEILLKAGPRASTSVLIEWLAEMKFTAEFLCG